MVSSKTILITAQNEGGRLAPVVFDAASVARKLAADTGGSVAAVLTGPPGTEALAEQLWAAGVAEVYVAEHAALTEARPEPHALATAAAVRQAEPSLVIVGQTLLGRDMAPYLAARLDTGILMNATDIRHSSSGATEAVCPIYGGGVTAVYQVSDSPPTVVGFQPVIRSTEESASHGPGKVISVDAGLEEFNDRV